MIIGFTGAGATGKTTLATLVANHSKGFVYRPSAARDVFKRWGLTEEQQRQLTPQTALQLQMEIWDAKAELDKQAVSDSLNGLTTIFDRTPIDHWAYTLYRCGATLTSELYAKIYARTYNELVRYDVVFYTPLVTFSGTDDGMRETGFGYRVCIDILIRNTINELKPALHNLGLYVPIIDPESRTNWVIDTLRRIKEVDKS